jgi:hypothetical protein
VRKISNPVETRKDNWFEAGMKKPALGAGCAKAQIDQTCFLRRAANPTSPSPESIMA